MISVDTAMAHALAFGSPARCRRVSVAVIEQWSDKEALSSRLDLRTGVRMWNAAHAMCQLLSLHPHLYARKTVLELGCGVASSAAVASDGASFILATDGADGVLPLARRNLLENTPPKEGVCSADANIDRKTAVLRWGVAEDINAARNAVSEWRRSAVMGDNSIKPAPPVDHETDDGVYDLVLAADCLFPRPLDPETTILKQCLKLSATAKELLSRRGVFVTTFQARVRGMNRQLKRAAHENGLQLAFVHRKCITDKPGPVDADSVCFNPQDPILEVIRIAILAHSSSLIEAVMDAEGFELADPAEDEDDAFRDPHETLAGGLFADDDDDDAEGEG